MSVTFLKNIAAISTFLIAIIGGLFPLWQAKHKPHQHTLLSLGQALASGVFLGAALLHMLPDAVHNFNLLYPSSNFPLANLIAATGFVSLLLLEHIIEQLQKKRQSEPRALIHYLLIIVLSLHCFIEGTALGVNLSLASAFIIFIAIMAHKSLEGFAISSKLIAAHLKPRSIIYFVILVALMTPLGIATGAFASKQLNNQGALLLEGIFNAFAAGSFLYIATMHTLGDSGCSEKKFGVGEILAIMLGLSAMAVVAIWA